MTKYLVSEQDGYTMNFYLIGEDDKNLILNSSIKSWSQINGSQNLPVFKKIQYLLKYLQTQGFILGAEEFVKYSDDITLTQPM